MNSFRAIVIYTGRCRDTSKLVILLPSPGRSRDANQLKSNSTALTFAKFELISFVSNFLRHCILAAALSFWGGGSKWCRIRTYISSTFLYLAPLKRYHGLKSNMPMLDFNLRYLSIEPGRKKLYTSSNSTPFRTPWTKSETCNRIDVGEDRF